ncbi:MAG: S4 domain-containing protein, partial [Dehalococcoidia bacterium]
MPKRRLDVLLVQRGLAQSREKAQTAILAGDVLVNGEPVLRQAASVPEDARIELAAAPRFVGR